MKHIFKRTRNSTLFLFIILLFFSSLIWLFGPILSIAQHFPLLDPQKRVALILAIILVWLIKFIFMDTIKKNAPSMHMDIPQMRHALQGHFMGAMKFLKKTIIDKQGFSTPLNKLPWYLLIGPPNSGKTTLLAYSNSHFILSKQYKPDSNEKSMASSSVCDWWVTRDIVLVDVPGCYTFSPPKNALMDSMQPVDEHQEAATSTASHAHLTLWKSFLNLLVKYRQKSNISAIVLAFHLPELIKLSHQQQTQWFQDMKQRLTECWDKLGNLPVYFIVTKCDLLPGFCDFFCDIGSDELLQPWGIPLSGRKEHEKLLDVFAQRFNALIKRLNKQLIWRLHQEHNAQLRPLIKDFPLQLEFLKETLTHLIKMLTAANPALELEGIYLTSAAQENVSSSASTLFHHDVPGTLPIPSPSPFISRAYFVKQVISYLLPHTSHPLVQRLRQKNAWLSHLIYTIGFSLLFIGALWLGKDFQRSLYQISSIQRYLMQYEMYLQQQNTQQDSSIASIYRAMPLLNTLQAAAQLPSYSSRLHQIEAFYTNKSQKTAVMVYHKALQTIVLHPIKNELEKYLQSTGEDNPEQLYNALKAYLMLKQQASVPFILHELEQISPVFNKKQVTEKLLQHMQNALQIYSDENLDTRLIQQTRKTLNHLPHDDLAYILLKSMGDNAMENEINLGTNIGTPPALISKGTATLIPYMFTEPAFNGIIKNEILLAAQETMMGNPVLGKKSPPTNPLAPSTASVSVSVNALAEQLKSTYLANYIDIWESLIDNISLNFPKNFTETDAMIMNLISDHSPLLQLLDTIHNNTPMELILSGSPKLQALNILFEQTQAQQKESLYQIFIDLHALHTLLLHASTHPFTGEEKIQNAAIDAVLNKDQPGPIAHIRAMAEKYPDPIKSWLQTLVSYTQQYLPSDVKLSTGLQAKTLSEENRQLLSKEIPLQNTVPLG